MVEKMTGAMWLASLGLAAAVAMGPGVGTAGAQDGGKSGVNVSADDGVKAEPSPSIEALERVSDAGRLIRFAREYESATAMVAAVQMLRTVRIPEDASRFDDRKTEPVEGVVTTMDGDGGKPAAEPRPVMLTKAGMLASLDEARQWAVGDEAMAALVEAEAEAVRAMPDRSAATMGRVGGPARHVDRVSARTIDTYTMRFERGEPAWVAIDGDGDTDLDLYIYDANDNLIVCDTGRSDSALVRWTPRWTGEYKVKIKNLGGVWNQYLLTTN